MIEVKRPATRAEHAESERKHRERVHRERVHLIRARQLPQCAGCKRSMGPGAYTRGGGYCEPCNTI